MDGQLNDITIGDAGLGVLIFDGSTLTGTVEINEGIEATGASINTGIPAGGTGEQAVALNGSSPTFFVPTGLAPDQAGLILDNIQSGNLFLQVDLADGTSQTGAILLPGVSPIFAELNGDGAVPAVEAFSTGQGNMNLNTETGDYVAVVTFVNLNPEDVDADGNSQTISAVQIANGAAGESGAAIVDLTAVGDGVTWTAQGTFSETDLATVSEGNANFTALGTDGSEFLRGQIPAQ